MREHVSRAARAALLAWAVSACTSEPLNGDAPLASAPDDPDLLPADAPFPTVRYHDGPLLTAPALVTVTFADDALADSLAELATTIASSPWWDEVRAGYCESGGSPCVGPGPAGVHVALAQAADASYTDSIRGGDASLKSWLASAIADGTLPAPAAGSPSNTLYVLHLPANTTVTLDGTASCQDGTFAGYHDDVALPSGKVAYAVMVDCTLPAGSTLTPLDSATLTYSHELIEAATDPVGTGFFLDFGAVNTDGWLASYGGEVADLCFDLTGFQQDVAKVGAFSVQRSWSVARAAARLDPCVPLPANVPYFNGAPRKATFGLGVGESATFDIDLFSQPAGLTWSLAPIDVSNGYLELALQGATHTSAGDLLDVSDGETVRATVTLTRDPSALPRAGVTAWFVSLGGPPLNEAYLWPIFVHKQ